jgi:hypothetical protein
MMEAVRSPETSVIVYQNTQRNILEEKHFDTCHHDDLEPQLDNPCSRYLQKPIIDEVGLIKPMTAFSAILPCRLVEADRRFRGAYCLHHQGGTQENHDECLGLNCINAPVRLIMYVCVSSRDNYRDSLVGLSLNLVLRCFTSICRHTPILVKAVCHHSARHPACSKVIDPRQL